MTDDSIRNDPDYKEFYNSNKNDPSSARAADSKDLTVNKIRGILEKQFALELEFKEEEIQKIEQRISHTKSMLDRLRAYVAAGYFGSGGLVVPGSKAIINEPKAKKQKSAVEGLDPAATSSLLKNMDKESQSKTDENLDSPSTVVESNHVASDETGSRFYVSKKLIVGNVSKYLLADSRKENDQSTHKWMVYVRTESGDDKEIDKYVKCVLFFLHPSYIPNDIVTVSKPPFQVTRRGWGEFPVRVQLHFRDSRNKRFDVIHNLKLDKTYTGLQTLGAETIVNIELHKHANNESEIISKSSSPSPAPPPLSQEDSSDKTDSNNPTKENTFSKEDIEQLKSSLPLPVIADLKSKLPTVECASSCVSSANPSRCNSPVSEISFFSNIIPLETEIDCKLYNLIQHAPLIATEGVKSKFFTCPSIETYESWHFTKRRAFEWYRASYLRKLYAKNYQNVTRCPSTKEILVWLRQCGFTPPEKDLNVILRTLLCCRKCGKCLTRDHNKNTYCSNCKDKVYAPEPLPDSLSPYTSVLSNVKIKEETLQCLEKAVKKEESDSDIDLDIVQVPTILSTPKYSAIEPSDDILPTLAETWISDVLYQFGVQIKPYILGNTKTPVVQAMLLRAMKLFMCHLLRKSNMEAKVENTNTLEPALITFRQVHLAILKEPLFDFLTDAHLGKL